MALVKYGGGVVQMAGSIGGNTFARNRYGNYARAKTKPINPNKPLQNEVRASLTAMSNRWSQIVTATERTAWNLYAASVAMKNRLGEVVYLSGYNHYMRSNVIREYAGLAPIDAGPVIFELPEKDPSFSIAAASGAQEISYTFDNALGWANEVGGYMFKFQGMPQNPQRNFFDGPWNLHGLIAGAVSPPSSADVQGTPPYVVTALHRQWCYARVTRADGRLSEPFRADCFST